MKHSNLEDDLYMIILEGEVVDWTSDLTEARERALQDEYQYRRYSKNPIDRKPCEKVQGENYQQLNTLAESEGVNPRTPAREQSDRAGDD